MSKTILAQVAGFTPLIDGVVADVGLVSAAVFGKAWRYCQMSDGVCKASQSRIAEELDLSRDTINAHFAKLVDAGYLEDMTPDLLGLPHQYRDTGKANLSISFTGGCRPNPQLPVDQTHTKKEVKKETKEKEEEQAQVFRAYSSEIGILTPMIADSINEWIKDGFPIKWMCDAIHEAALQNKRNWKYCEAIIKRWDAQGSQEEMKKPVSGYKQKPNEPKAFEAIREFMKSQGVDNGDITGSIQNDSAYQRGVPQLECKPVHDPSLL